MFQRGLAHHALRQIDADNAVAARASYAATPSSMSTRPRNACTEAIQRHSWIRVHPELSFGFKAVVCHDRVRVHQRSILGRTLTTAPGVRHALQRLVHG